MTEHTPLEQPRTKLGRRFRDALLFGMQAHDGQYRKGTPAPYYSHPMQVAGIALEHGADEEQACAALLHDVLEDTTTTYEDLLESFGRRVADIVRACSDTEDHEDKGDWRERKEQYLQHLRGADADVALVSCADKLHNARSIVMDLRGLEAQARRAYLKRQFKGKRKGTLWYYRALVDTFRELPVPKALCRELRGTVEQMEELA